MTKFYGKAEQVSQAIIEQFKAGDLPDKLAPLFVERSDSIPSMSWSWNNRLLLAMRGCFDARGFKQWQKVGRKVSKGARALYILGPVMVSKENKETGEKDSFLVGFKSIPVFAIESTEIFNQELWEKHGQDKEETDRLQGLPLFEVAQAWGMEITSYNGRKRSALGFYSPGRNLIALGVKNLSTWTHELCHKADDELGYLTKGKGQDPENEIVAELGGAVLLTMMGEKIEADLGGAWDYVKNYSDGDDGKAVRKCISLINRVCSCVNLIIETAEALQAGDEEQAISAVA